MNKEGINSNINQNEAPVSQETKLRSGLARSVRVIADLRRQAEQNGLAAGSDVAEKVILQNIPVMEYVVDGDLRTKLGPDANVEVRINSLPLELVASTQGRIDSLVSIMNAVLSIAPANRLEGYFPFALPKTREGFGALQFISTGYATVFGIPRDEMLVVGVSGTTKTLGALDSAVLIAARNDDSLINDLLEDARGLARQKLPELLEEDSSQIKKLRAIVAEQKLSRMRREVAKTDGDINYSKYELLINDIIEQEKLADQIEEAQKRKEAALEKPKETILTNLTRRRAIQRVVSLLEADPLLCEALAKRERMTPEELLAADEATKRKAVNNVLNSRTIVLSVEERRAFNGYRVIADERRQIEEGLQDPLVFVSKLSDEEIAIIRSGIPRISDRRSVFYLAKDRLREQTENEVTDEELLEALTLQTVRELLPSRCTMAVDLAIKSLGIDTELLLKDPNKLIQMKDEILVSALKFLIVDSAKEATPVKAVTLTDSGRRAAREAFINSFRRGKLTGSVPSLDARVLLDQFVATPQTAMLGPIIDSQDIKSSLSPFSFLPKYKTIYPPVVIQALGNLFAEYNEAFRPLVAVNREWETDYQYCISADGTPVNAFAQIDMVGLPAGFLVAAASMSEEEVREALRGRIFEIENSIAMYQYLENLFSEGGQDALFKRQFFSSLDRIRQKVGRPIALLAVTDQKFQAMREIEFGKMDGELLTDQEIKGLSGFDRFFGPTEFQKYLADNKGQCDYLLYVRSSDPVAKMKNPEMVVEDTILGDNNLRKIIKANALTFNIDNPSLPMGDRRRINDTKEYLEQIGMAFTAFYGGDLISGGRLSVDFETYIRLQGIDPREVEAGRVALRAKPMKGTYGGYGHIRGTLGEAKFRRELRRNLRSRGAYVVQPEMQNPIITNEEDGQTFVYIDRNFFSTDGENYEFMGGERTLIPVGTREAQNNRIHGNSSSVYAEIIDIID